MKWFPQGLGGPHRQEDTLTVLRRQIHHEVLQYNLASEEQKRAQTRRHKDQSWHKYNKDNQDALLDLCLELSDQLKQKYDRQIMEKKLRILAEREMDRQDAQSLTDYLEDQNNRRVSEMLRTYNDVVSITSPRRMRQEKGDEWIEDNAETKKQIDQYERTLIKSKSQSALK